VLVLLFGSLSSLACLVASFSLVSSLVALVASSLVALVEPLVVVWLSAKLVLALHLELCRRLALLE
jgi:hypothetical protein